MVRFVFTLLVMPFFCVLSLGETNPPDNSTTAIEHGTTDIPNFEALDEPLTDIESVKLEILKPKGDRQYLVPAEPTTLRQRMEYESLSEEQKELFHHRRILALRHISRLLHRSRLTFGLGMATKNKILQLVPSGETLRHPIRAIINRFKPRDPNAEPKPKIPIRELAEPVVQRLLHSVNNMIWTHPKLITNANEAGFSLSAGGSAGVKAGPPGKGIYHGLEVGFSFGFNWERKAMVFDIFSDYERVNRIVGIAAKVAVNGKAQVHVRAVGDGEMEVSRGNMYYPPTPGSFMETQNSFHTGTGAQLGIGTTAPFLPFPWIGYMDSRMTRIPWLRLGVSFTGPKFLVVQGKLADVAYGGLMRVVDILTFIPRKAYQIGHRIHCRKAFDYLARGLF